MEELCFVWDDNKAAANQQKHGITFGEAVTAFYDDFARVISDCDHSVDEERFLLLGMSAELRILVVCHCYRENENHIRIISARRAVKREQQQYWEFRT
jgi:uncharacterized DUF497 family protein